MASIAVILDNILGCVDTVFTLNNIKTDEKVINVGGIIENGTTEVLHLEEFHRETVKDNGNMAEDRMKMTEKARRVPLLECPDCFCPFGDDHLPRNLSCGHTLCTACAVSLITDEKPCLECHDKPHRCKTKDLPVNYQLLRLSRSAGGKGIHFVNKKTLLSTGVSQSSFNENIWKCGTHGSPKVFFCLSCNLWICENCLVLEHASPPRGSCTILQYANATAKIRTRYLEISNKLSMEIDEMKDNFELEFGMHDFCIKHCTKERSHLRVVEKLESVLLEKSKLHNEEVDKVTERLIKLTDSFHATDLPEETAVSCKELLSFQEELKNLIEDERARLTPHRPKMIDHFRMEIRRLLQGKEPVYATLQEDGRIKWSRLSVVNGRLLLYALNEGTPPNNGIQIPYKYMEMLESKTGSWTVFFEVESDGENSSGRVFVKLQGRNPLTNQMHLMCSGKKGVSYRNTRFFQKEKGRISGGEYKRSDGKTGGTIVEGLGGCSTNNVYRSMNSRAAVIGERTSTKFHILLQNDQNHYSDALGNVTQGFNVIKAVANQNSVENSYIKNCGIFVSMKMPPYNNYDTDDDSDCEE